MNSHRVAAAATAVVALVLFAFTFGFEEMPVGITRGFGAEAFPRLVLGTIGALAALLAFTSPAGDALERIPAIVWYTGGALLLFMALVPVAGMLPAMLLFLIGLGYLWGERRYWLLLLSAAIMTALIWVIFVRGFGVQLPKGVFA